MKYSRIIVLIGLLFLRSTISVADTLEIEVFSDGRVMSAGANGQTLYDDEEDVVTSMSGGSNISDGLYEFDLSVIPEGATITSASLLLRTSAIVTNTQTDAPIEFFGFTGNGIIELEDQANSATLLKEEVLQTPIPNNTDLEVEFDNLIPLNSVLTDESTDDFLTIRSETENFVLLRVDSLESTDSDAAPALLVVTYSGGVLLGDINQDCSVDLLDVAAFVSLIQTGTFQDEADINQDGSVDLLDVEPFVDLLTT